MTRTGEMEPLNRRSFLAGLAGVGLSQCLTGCSGQSKTTLALRLLNGSISTQTLNEFRKSLKDTAFSVTPEPQLQTLFSLLQTWQQAKPSEADVPDLVTLGDAWLEKAIQQSLIQPLNLNQTNGWTQLPDRWKAIVTRTTTGQPIPIGQVWGAPYRYGGTVIAYRQDVFKERGLALPTDWSDLWRSDLRDRISLPNQAREVIGLTLKKLGKSYNTADLNTVPPLSAELDALRSQVKLYSSDAYLQPLILGDTWLAVGSSLDVLTAMPRNPQIAAIVPKSGTALWADLWVRPAVKSAALPAVVTDWIGFCWQPTIARQAPLSGAASPISALPIADLPPVLRQNSALLLDPAVLQASEFLQPQTQATVEQYRAEWLRLRQTG